MRLRAVMTVLAVAALSGGALAAEADNQRTAQQDAASALRLLRLPPGAQRGDANPAADPQLLEAPGPGQTSAPNHVAQTEFWRVPGEPREVFAWIKAHRPAGTRI